MPKLKELDNKLKKLQDGFAVEVQQYLARQAEPDNPTTENLNELCRMVFYLFGDFRESIIDYLGDSK